MHVICLTPVEVGVYNDHRAEHIIAPPEGWAYIPDDMPLPSTFPRLGSLEAEELTYTRMVEVQKTRYVPVLDNDGNPMLDEAGEPITQPEPYTDKAPQEYKMMTVTHMTEGTLPEVVPEPEPATELSVWDELDAAYQEGVDSV